MSNFNELFFYVRYGDDCFRIWKYFERRLKRFYQFLNSFDKGLQFTIAISEEYLCFLDLKISILDSEFPSRYLPAQS